MPKRHFYAIINLHYIFIQQGGAKMNHIDSKGQITLPKYILEIFPEIFENERKVVVLLPLYEDDLIEIIPFTTERIEKLKGRTIIAIRCIDKKNRLCLSEFNRKFKKIDFYVGIRRIEGEYEIFLTKRQFDAPFI